MAAPCRGAVLHTLNIRLFAEQIVYVVNHARDKVICIDSTLVPLIRDHIEKFEHVEHYIVMGEGDTDGIPDPISYEELLAGQDGGFAYPRLDDRMVAVLCYTSG